MSARARVCVCVCVCVCVRALFFCQLTDEQRGNSPHVNVLGADSVLLCQFVKTLAVCLEVSLSSVGIQLSRGAARCGAVSVSVWFCWRVPANETDPFLLRVCVPFVRPSVAELAERPRHAAHGRSPPSNCTPPSFSPPHGSPTGRCGWLVGGVGVVGLVGAVR